MSKHSSKDFHQKSSKFSWKKGDVVIVEQPEIKEAKKEAKKK